MNKVQCPGAGGCGITSCQHYRPHDKTDGCDGGCLVCGGCEVVPELVKVRNGGWNDKPKNNR